MIQFTTPGSAPARLEIFDVSGRLVAELLDDPVAEGEHAAFWKGRDAAGCPVASGLYLCRLTFRGEVRSTRLLLLR
jgi:hypothetical protein